jgi:sugar lactone lactonase YvrE
VDAAGNLFVADFGNNRVLEYDSPLTTDTKADTVFGQMGSFSSGTCDDGGLSASSMCFPRGVAVDAAGSLYVGEFLNERVLVYENPLINQVADRVIGQPDFTTVEFRTDASSVSAPNGMVFDAAGNLYLADQGNSRVLIYLDPLGTFPWSDYVADFVIGQPDFSTREPNPGGVSASTLYQPFDVAVDVVGNLYVADTVNNRVLIYRTPLTTDTVADEVLGQFGFITNACHYLSEPMKPLCSPRGVDVDARGNLYVADGSTNRVLQYEVDMDWDGLVGAQDACPAAAPVPGFDLDHNGCTDSVQGLKIIVQGLSLSSKVKNGLLGKLDEAQKALDRGSIPVAVNKLQDFISQVEGQRGKGISNADADLLVAYARNLITLLKM